MYERFMELMQKRGVTAYRVAKDTGVTQTTLSDWKTGRAIPKVATLQKIANYFDVPVDYLIGNTDNKNSLLASKLLEKIEEKGYELFQLSVLTNIPKERINAYFDGNALLNFDEIHSIINAINESLSDFAPYFFGTNENTTKEELPEEIVILNRAAKKMTPEQRQKLLDMAKVMFEEEFDD